LARREKPAGVGERVACLVPLAVSPNRREGSSPRRAEQEAGGRVHLRGRLSRRQEGGFISEAG